MHIIKSVLSVALFAAAAVAQGGLAFTSTPNNVQAGQPYTITWSGGDASAPVAITLQTGNPGDLKTVGSITST